MKLEKIPNEFMQALPVLEKLHRAGFEAYFVGGSVRDALLGRAIHDVDIATSAYPAEVKHLFRRTIDVGIAHGTVLVLANGGKNHYEITTFRTESAYTDFRRPDTVAFVRELSEDLLRRDFTVNALAMKADGAVIDLFDGLSDLTNRRLRAVGKAEDRFQEDALRIMRALRFSATLGFEIEAATFAAMKSHAHLLKKISVERIFAEIDQLLLAEGWRNGLSGLTTSGVWAYLPDFQKIDLINLTDDFKFKNSVEAWAWLTLQFKGKLDLRHWKVSKELIKATSNLTEAYALEKWDLMSLYKYGLTTCQLADDLKIGQGKKIDRELPLRLDAQLQIHKQSEMALKGADLIKMGFAAGPKLGEVLSKLEDKIVTNALKNEKSELLKFAEGLLI